MDSIAFVLLMLMVVVPHGSAAGERPAVVNIGAVLTYESIIGRIAKVAIVAAVDDVNTNKEVLNGTRLNLITDDANCSVFIGTISGNKCPTL
ncbi:Glutamate receptor 3.4 [Apostasia shenzhenica]|uniref:Glutamate receptor 3.4 n=1 Tax=Apostasia shenzhenica TaxID=1088818 RepID=A0A2I0BFD7_9ASPA|nr:Glutamate receptor 3.4 [Apostasia shenzhenica]